MATTESVKAKIQSLIGKSNEATGKSDTTMTDAVNSLITQCEEGGGGAELNIAYGDTVPEDTSKLWVKTSEPSGVVITPNTSGAVVKDKIETVSDTNYSKVDGMCCATIDGKVYAFGGRESNTYTRNNAYVFRNSSGKWTRNKTSATLYIRNACCVAIGTYIYIFGGVTGSSASDGAITNKIHRFDSVADSIGSLTNVTLPKKLMYSCCAAVGTKVYLFGGNTNNGGTWTDEIYCVDITNPDSITATTITTAKFPTTRQNMCCAAVGEKIYIFGGQGDSTDDLVFCFDTTNGQLDELTIKLPKKMAKSACAAIGKKIYIFGGCVLNTDTNIYDIYCFDTANPAKGFTKSPAVLEVSPSGMAATTFENQIMLFGGSVQLTSSQSEATNIVRLFSGRADFSLESEELHIVLSESNNLFKLVNTGLCEVEIGFDSILKGNEDGIGEPVEAALYKDGAWTTV